MATQETPAKSSDPIVGLLQIKPQEGDKLVVELREGQAYRVGRVASNDLVLADTQISRFHAVFNASSSGIVLSDLSSLNGTFVNGRRISVPTNLSPGDQITVGSTEVLVQAGQLNIDEAAELSAQSTMAAQMRAVIVTVLLADVSGYTRMSEQVPGREVAEMLQRWFSEVSEVVTTFGGEVDKYIGDCVMALWRGSFQTAAEQAVLAGRAAEAILKLTEQLSQSPGWPHREEFPWRCRISLNTGEALLGTLGGSGSRDFTVLGDTVNVAFRLNDLAGTLRQEVILSAGTAKLLEGSLEVESLGTSPLEGRTEQVAIFRLVR